MTKFMQTDSRWGNLGYPEAPYCLRNCGCGEVSIANILIEMPQYAKYTPATIQPYCKQYADKNGNGTILSGIPKMLEHYGLTEVKEHQTMKPLWEELAKGKRVAVFLMGNKLGGTKKVRWTQGGHLICAVKYKYENSKHYVYVKDSYSNSSLRNGFISYEENLQGDVLRVWSGKMNDKLIVDGNGGKATVIRMQDFFSTKQDGVITGQKEANKKYYSALHSVKFGKGGSSCIKNLQRWVGTTQDGVLGEKTVKAWQTKLKAENYYTGSIDGHFGTNSMKAWQKYLNEHEKAVYPPKPTETPQQKMCAWARKIASDNSWHYVKWSSNKKTHECPICHNHAKGKYHGWNCIGFCFASWRHGAGIKCKCNCSVINNDEAKQILTASTDAKALALAQKLIGIKDIKVLRNKNGLSQSQLNAGDICIRFSGTTAKHFWLYLGNGQMADARGSNGKVPNNDQISVRKAQSCKVAIRYTGK